VLEVVGSCVEVVKRSYNTTRIDDVTFQKTVINICVLLGTN
jgi:hypothetical protein